MPNSVAAIPPGLLYRSLDSRTVHARALAMQRSRVGRRGWVTTLCSSTSQSSTAC